MIRINSKNDIPQEGWFALSYYAGAGQGPEKVISASSDFDIEVDWRDARFAHGPYASEIEARQFSTKLCPFYRFERDGIFVERMRIERAKKLNATGPFDTSSEAWEDFGLSEKVASMRETALVLADDPAGEKIMDEIFSL